jgi:hypothetical protein
VWRKVSLRSLFALLTSVLALGQGPVAYGGATVLSARHASVVAQGAHCPLMSSGAHHQHSSAPNDCPMHKAEGQGYSELRCVCPHQTPSASPELSSLRFVLLTSCHYQYRHSNGGAARQYARPRPCGVHLYSSRSPAPSRFSRFFLVPVFFDYVKQFCVLRCLLSPCASDQVR